MPRWFVFLLTFCFPLQSTWAAWEAVCADRDQPAVEHVGHHSHVQAEVASDAADPEPSGFSADCPACHLLVATPPRAVATVLAEASSNGRIGFVAPGLPAPAPANPFRPPAFLVS